MTRSSTSFLAAAQRRKAWMPGTRPGMTKTACLATASMAWSRCACSEAAMMITRRNALLGSVALAVLSSRANAAPIHIAVTKGPGCECCEGWAAHLRANGYSVTVSEAEDLEAV